MEFMGVRQGRAKERRAGGLAQTGNTRRRAADAGMWALLVGATLAAYLPVMRGALLWDDNMHVTRADLRSLHGLWRIWFDLGATQQYYPLLHSAFWLEYRLWGDAVLGYHLTNVCLHALAACLVVLLVRRLSLPGAWLAGFIFALHPVCVDAVAWITEQKSTLSAVFCLAAALAYLRFDRTRRKSPYFVALGLFVLALMSKTVTATLPAALLVIFWWQRGRIAWKRDALPLVPWFAVGIPAGLFTAWVERTPRLIGAQGADYALTLPQRLLLAGRAPWFYAWKALWPSDLMFFYPRWKVDSGDWRQYLFPLATAALVVALAWLAVGRASWPAWAEAGQEARPTARKRRGPLAGFLIFAGTLFPALGFLNVYPFRYSFVADHFQYLAILGIVVPAAAGLMVLAGRIPPGRIAAIALSALLLATLGAATWRRSGVYRDEVTLFRDNLPGNPDGPDLHNFLGVALMRLGRGPEAVPEFEAAVRLRPDNASFHNNLGLALASLPGRGLAAAAEFQAALRLDPQYQAALLNLGGAYAQMPGRQPDAIAEYREALRLNPESATAHFQLGNSFQTTGRLEEAIAEYRVSLRIDPSALDVRYELAYSLAKIPGRVPEAIAECREILRIHPDNGPTLELLKPLLEFQSGRGR
jgi:tetratricopeptide (TPR) repeat protein